MRNQRYGFTLIETLVVLGIITLVSISIAGLFIRSSQVYAHAAGRIEPQTSQLLALKRMENEIRQAYTISLSEDNPEANTLTLTMPDKTDGDLIRVYSMDANVVESYDDILVGVKPGDTITYRARRETAEEGGIDFVGNSRIDTFKLVREVTHTDGTEEEPETLIWHITKREEDEEEDSEFTRMRIFELVSFTTSFDDEDEEDVDEDIYYAETHLLKINLVSPYEEQTPHGKEFRLHSVATEFLLRNSGRASKNN